MKLSLALGGLALILAGAPVQAQDVSAAEALMKKSGCLKCHSVSAKKEGPPFKETAAKVAPDEYSGRTLGPREGSASFVSLDAVYTLSEKWQAMAWTSRSDTRAGQQTCLGALGTPPAVPVPTHIGLTCPTTAGNGVWEARLRNVGDAIGLGLKGKPTGVLEVGGELSWTKDTGGFEQLAITPGIITPAIPDAVYTVTTLKLNARYATTKNSGVRLQCIFDRFKAEDWYWTSWVYADSDTSATTVTQEPVQKVHFIGASYYYQF